MEGGIYIYIYSTLSIYVTATHISKVTNIMINMYVLIYYCTYYSDDKKYEYTKRMA
jgi:hypothetical protein